MTALDFADALIRYCVAMDAEVSWWGPSVPNGWRLFQHPSGALHEWTAAEVTYRCHHDVTHRLALAELLGLRLEPAGLRDRLSTAPGPRP